MRIYDIYIYIFYNYTPIFLIFTLIPTFPCPRFLYMPHVHVCFPVSVLLRKLVVICCYALHISLDIIRSSLNVSIFILDDGSSCCYYVGNDRIISYKIFRYFVCLDEIFISFLNYTLMICFCRSLHNYDFTCAPAI